MTKYVAVSDAFSDQFIGGAEFTTDAILSPRLDQVTKINSKDLTEDFILDNKDKTWLIFNFHELTDKNKISLTKNVNYSIIEYDYKLCEYRSPDIHLYLKKVNCDCVEEGYQGKIKKVFYGHAKKIWFMSEKQKKYFLNSIHLIKEENTEVLSSVFKKGDLRFIESLSGNEKNNTYLILNSHFWTKGTKSAFDYAKENKLPIELVSGLEYHELLIKLSTSKGIVFMPNGRDTCPRFIIEAKLLGCDIITNDNVEHRDEPWFQSVDLIKSHLDSRTKVFWSFYEK